jgi:hypothetical protein
MADTRASDLDRALPLLVGEQGGAPAAGAICRRMESTAAAT